VAEPLASQAVGPSPGWQVAVVADVLRVEGDGTPVGLLRALCEPAWREGVTSVRPRGRPARVAVDALGL
jgi:hypothetical protein